MEGFEDVKRLILEKRLKSPTWRLKKTQLSAYTRVQIVEVLVKAGKPMDTFEVAFETGLSPSEVRAHLKALVAGKVVCDRLLPSPIENPRTVYYAVCPTCPVRENCEFRKEMVWKSCEGGGNG